MFLIHTPRDGAVDDGYHEWIRSTDSPFFNSVPGIVHYSIWKVASKHPSINFTHFDLLEFDGPADNIWAHEPLGDFAANWTKMWSQNPESEDPSVNYQAYGCSHLSGDLPSIGGSLKLLLDNSDTSDNDTGDYHEHWDIDTNIVGESPWSKLAIKMDTPNNDVPWNDSEGVGLIASLIGAPRTNMD